MLETLVLSYIRNGVCGDRFSDNVMLVSRIRRAISCIAKIQTSDKKRTFCILFSFWDETTCLWSCSLQEPNSVPWRYVSEMEDLEKWRLLSLSEENRYAQRRTGHSAIFPRHISHANNNLLIAVKYKKTITSVKSNAAFFLYLLMTRSWFSVTILMEFIPLCCDKLILFLI
jgi:hypothetical protein